jgi:type VI secretion system protein VasG
MAHVDLKQLVNRLNSFSRDALEGAVGLCVSRTNYNVEIEHWLLKLLERPNTDFVVLLNQFGVDHSRLMRDLTRAIDGFRTGNSR